MCICVVTVNISDSPTANAADFATSVSQAHICLHIDISVKIFCSQINPRLMLRKVLAPVCVLSDDTVLEVTT